MDKKNSNQSIPLPKKLNLEMVASELDLLHLSSATQLEIILSHQREGRIDLKSDVPIDCNTQETSNGLDEHHDTNGNLVLFARGANSWVETSGKPLTLGPAYLTRESLVTIGRFTFEGKEYDSLDEQGMHPQWLYYNISDIYVDRANLKNHLQKGVEDTPSYANPSSENYAPELDLAIKLHKALRIEKEGNPNLNVEDRVYNWLTKNQPKGSISASQTKRLATVIGSGKQLYPKPK